MRNLDILDVSLIVAYFLAAVSIIYLAIAICKRYDKAAALFLLFNAGVLIFMLLTIVFGGV